MPHSVDQGVFIDAYSSVIYVFALIVSFAHTLFMFIWSSHLNGCHHITHIVYFLIHLWLTFYCCGPAILGEIMLLEWLPLHHCSGCQESCFLRETVLQLGLVSMQSKALRYAVCS